MGFFEDIFARAGRAIDDTLGSIADAFRERSSSGDGAIASLRRLAADLWSTFGEWFEGEDARARRWTAAGVASSLCVLILGMAAWRAVRPDPPPPLTDQQKALISTARRQVELHNFKDREERPKTSRPGTGRASRPNPPSNPHAAPTRR